MVYAMRMLNYECINRLRKFDIRENYKKTKQINLSFQDEQQEIKTDYFKFD